MKQHKPPHGCLPAKIRRREAGLTLMELIMVLFVCLVMMGFALPQVATQVKQYRLKSAVSAATWAIQSTRFQALEVGYPIQVTFQGDASGNNPTYQIASKPSGATSFTNVGTSVPLSGSPVNLTATTVVQFQPNGVVAVTAAGVTVSTMQLSFSGYSNTITVSNYGNVSVTSP